MKANCTPIAPLLNFALHTDTSNPPVLLLPALFTTTAPQVPRAATADDEFQAVAVR